MVKIAVFDSGFGSLSIIKPIQKKIKSEIVYFADQKNYPYGMKNKSDLLKIIKKNIIFLETKFNPDLIIIASNTPSLLFENLLNKKIIGVFPPLITAKKISKTKNIAILSTKNITKSKELRNYIRKHISTKDFLIHKINASRLVDLVESGKFLTDIKYCEKIIKTELNILMQKKIDTVTLSSTHLPFLKKVFEKQFPDIVFLDPADGIATRISKMSFNKSKRNSIKIFSSGNAKKFEKQLAVLKIKSKVSYLSV